MKTHTLVWMLLVVLLAGCSSTASTPEEVPTETPAQAVSMQRLTFAGSTTVQPLAQKLAEAYKQKHSGIEMEIGAGGSRVGIQAIQEGSADIGMASREIREEEQREGMEVHQIAVDVLAMIVHPDNPIDELSLEQLQAIYTGEITNWQEVGGNDVPILAVIREVSSGTRGAFDDIVLDGEDPLETEDNTHITAGEIHTRVASTEEAIGYVGFGHLSGDDVKIIRIDGVEPSPEVAIDGTYKLKRPLHMLTGPLSRPEAKNFIDYVLSPEGQSLVVEMGWVSVAPID